MIVPLGGEHAAQAVADRECYMPADKREDGLIPSPLI
jgi:hypothetical protein